MQSVCGVWPNDIEELHALLAQQRARNAQLEVDKKHLQSRVVSLQEQLNLALARRFAARSEKLSPDRIRLFDEAEAAGDAAADTSPEPATVEIAAHTRKARGRRPLPEALPRVEIIHELPSAERQCPHDGAVLAEIAQVVSEQLDIVPAKIRVLRHVRKQYACACGQCIKTAPLPAQPIPKSLASPGLLAHVAISKYRDALPLYRQEQILARIGIELPRATLANWMIAAGQLVQPLINLLRDRLLDYDIVQMDETPVQVLNEPSKTACAKPYLWLQRGGPPEQRVILFDYDPSRGAAVPKRLLEGFTGTLQTDGYGSYAAVVALQKLIHIGCFAHARRKFADAVKVQGRSPPGRAHKGLAFIRKLYAIEAHAREMTPAQRYCHRQRHARPVLDKLRAWLDAALPHVPPSTTLGKALAYLHRQWPALIGYLNDGRYEIDNNRAENALRPFVLGRKNWLFSNSVGGVKASANLYSLIETAKANGLEPYAYLRRVFTELPKANTVAAIEALLPGHLR
jgi:transposase